MTLRVAQFFLKIAHLSFSMGPRGPRAYGLRPRLWLLVETRKVAAILDTSRPPAAPQPITFTSPCRAHHMQAFY